MDEKENINKNDAASRKKNKSKRKPKWKRRVTIDTSAENKGNLVITQKVRVKKQKIKCTFNFTNICQIKEKPIKSDVQKCNTSGNRIVPHCSRKLCKQIIQSKIKQHHQEKAKVKEYPKEAKSSKGKKRAHTKNFEESLKSSKRCKCEDKDVSYDDISPDSLDNGDKLDLLYVDNKLDTLIMRTKARERILSEASEVSHPKPLYTSTPLREAADDYEDIVSSSANMDVSINSQDTLILEPKLELLSPQNLKEHCFTSCEQNFDPLKACSSSDFYQEFFHINENTPENLVISVDPFLASSGWESKVKAFLQSDANQVFLDVNSLSPKNTIIPKEPAISCKQEHNQVSQEFLDNCVLSVKNFEEVSCMTPCSQVSEDIIADYKTNDNQLFVGNKTESFPFNYKNTTQSSKLKSHSDLEINKHNAILMNHKNVSGNKSNSQTLSSINLLWSENENNALCINVPFKFKEPTMESVEDNSEDTKDDSGIDFNQNSLHDNIPIISAIDSRKEDSDYVTADPEIEVNNLDLDKSVTCKEPVIACGQISNVSAGNQVALEKSQLLYKKAKIPVEPAVVVVYMAQNTEEPIFSIDHYYNNSDVSRLENNSDEPNKPMEPRLEQNSKESSAPGLEQNTEEPPEPRLEHNSKEQSAPGLEQNIEEPSAPGLEQNVVEPPEPSLEQNSKEQSAPGLEHNAEEPPEPSLEHNSNEPSAPGLEQNVEEPPEPSLEQNSKEQSAPGLEHNAEEPPEPSLEHNSNEPSAPGLEQNVEEPPEPSLEQNSNEPSAPGLEQNVEEPPEPSLEQNSKEIKLNYNSNILWPAAVVCPSVITEDSTVIDLKQDFKFEVNKAALELESGFHEHLTTSSHSMTNHDLNSTKEKYIDDKPKCILTGPKIPTIINMKHEPETSSTSEHLRSLSSTNRRCTYNNPNEQYLDRTMETQITALDQALSKVTQQYRPANMYGRNQSYAHRRNNNGYNANRWYRYKPIDRTNLQVIQNTPHCTTCCNTCTPIATHARVKLESNLVKLPGPASVKYELNKIKQETTDSRSKTEKNVTVKRENFASSETNSFVANKSVMNDNLIRFIKKEPLD